MPEQNLQAHIHSQVSVEPVQADMGALQRPERVLPGSDVQAQIALAVVGRIDERHAVGIPVSPQEIVAQEVPRATYSPRLAVEAEVLSKEGSPQLDEQEGGAGPSTNFDLAKNLGQERDFHSTQAGREVAQREAVVGRVRQELSQNVEQVRLDINHVTQGRTATEALRASTLGEEVTQNPSSAIAAAPSEIGKIGTSLPQVREQLLERIAHVQEQLHILSASSATRVETPTNIQGRGDFRGNAELRHDAKPEVVVTREDRSQDSPLSRVEVSGGGGRSTEPAWLRPTPRNDTARVIDKPLQAPAVERANRSFDVVARLVKTCSDIRLVQRIQESVDILCFTLFGVVAIGALAGDRATRFTYRSLRRILAEMRTHAVDEEITVEDRPVVEESSQELAHALVDLSREVDQISASTVADVCGIIVHAETTDPVSGVVVIGGTLGEAITDERGIFIFKNVPFHTPYEITPMHSSYRFTPTRIVGSCVELNFERFSAQRRTG